MKYSNKLEFIGRKLRPVELALLTKWLLRIKRQEIILPGNHKFFIDPISEFGLKLMKNNSYEVDMTNQIQKVLKEGDTFIDLGANEGFFSIVASKIVGSKGLVIAVEPQQRLWEVIVKNVELNNLCNVMLLPYGVGAERGEAHMSLYPNLNSGASSIAKSFNFKVSLKKFRKAIYSSTKISVNTLDELVHVSQEIKLVKIDIEGFELEALKGSSELLRSKKIKNLLIEIHPEALQSLNQSESDIDSFLTPFGYKKLNVAVNLVIYQLAE